MTSQSLGGLAANQRLVVATGRDPLDRGDVFVALDVNTGQLLWRYAYPCDGPMDYGKAPRATPILLEERALLLGAYGHLACVDLITGLPLWKVDFQQTFGASLPTWGFCGSPLVIGDRVFVQTGAPHASLVCLDLRDGAIVWRAPGRDVSYSSFIQITVGGVDQIVGYDATTLGGWRMEDGEHLWELEPEHAGDFNVGTPLWDGQRLWVATENNGTRVFQFEENGRINPTPLAQHRHLAPDTQTPILVGKWLIGIWHGLYCLDRETLREAWVSDDEAFQSYASIIACGDRALLLCREGELVLLDLHGDQYRELGRARVSEDLQDIQSHPALVNRRLFVRLDNSVICILLPE